MTKEEKCRTTQVGRIVIHKGDNEKRVYENELEKYYQDGWQKGVSDKHRKNKSESQKGHSAWNKGIKKATSDHNSGVWQKGHIPWNKGLKGVMTSWCKGQTKETNESLRKMGITRKKTWDNSPELKKEFSKRMSEKQKGRKLTEQEKENYLKKCYITKKKNNTFNSSSIEKIYKKFLFRTFGEDNVLYNYKCDRYPFYCDFYIKSEDLFIELNAHWTHGGKPYNPNNKECQEQLQTWQEKAKTSQFYANAITTWTVRDVNKLKCAKDNNLHYITIYARYDKLTYYPYNVNDDLKQYCILI